MGLKSDYAMLEDYLDTMALTKRNLNHIAKAFEFRCMEIARKQHRYPEYRNADITPYRDEFNMIIRVKAWGGFE